MPRGRIKVNSTLQGYIDRQKGRCFYCNRLFTYNGHSRGDTNPTRDHKIPRSRGGSEVRDNIVAACERCNNRKADMTIYEFVCGWSHTIPGLRERFSIFWQPNGMEAAVMLGYLGIKGDGYEIMDGVIYPAL